MAARVGVLAVKRVLRPLLIVAFWCLLAACHSSAWENRNCNDVVLYPASGECFDSIWVNSNCVASINGGSNTIQDAEELCIYQHYPTKIAVYPYDNAGTVTCDLILAGHALAVTFEDCAVADGATEIVVGGSSDASAVTFE